MESNGFEDPPPPNWLTQSPEIGHDVKENHVVRWFDPVRVEFHRTSVCLVPPLKYAVSISTGGILSSNFDPGGVHYPFDIIMYKFPLYNNIKMAIPTNPKLYSETENSNNLTTPVVLLKCIGVLDLKTV